MKLNIIDEKKPVESIAVITPTVISEHLLGNIKSVLNQTHKNIKHHVVVDGAKYAEKLYSSGNDILELVKENPDRIAISVIYDNVGANNWYGHRIYAAFSYLCNQDAICFLDEDNWFEPEHVESLVKTLNEKQVDWAVSFRKIFSKEGEFLCEDNCESLGIYPVYMNDGYFHADTSSYCVRKDVAIKTAPAWYGQWGADRSYFAAMRQFVPSHASSEKHTLCYRLDGNPGSVQREFFEEGNKAMLAKHKGVLPWKNK